jgi:hypothetical protein
MALESQLMSLNELGRQLRDISSKKMNSNVFISPSKISTTFPIN